MAAQPPSPAELRLSIAEHRAGDLRGTGQRPDQRAAGGEKRRRWIRSVVRRILSVVRGFHRLVKCFYRRRQGDAAVYRFHETLPAWTSRAQRTQGGAGGLQGIV